MSLVLPRLPVATEKEIQRAVVQLFRAAGCTVCTLSQYRRSKVAVGLPDLFVFCPRRQMAWWWETKRPGGKLRPEQETFQTRCAECGERYYYGGLPEAVALMSDMDLVA